MKRLHRAWLAPLLLIALPSCGDSSETASLVQRFGLDLAGQAQWKLPARLREVSGLALSTDQRLFAVDDEQAVVYQFDYLRGKLVKAFALGQPTLRGDFEGIAWHDSSIYLISSDGMLYRAPEGEDGERVGYEVVDTGFGRQCEIEGLALEPRAARLLVLCKALRKKADIKRLSIFAWDLRAGRALPEERLELPVKAIRKRLDTKGLHPSGIALDRRSDSLLIVAAREQALVELDRDGRVLDAIMLPLARRHRQPEGIEISRSGQLFLADEGGKSKARITLYAAPRATDAKQE